MSRRNRSHGRIASVETLVRGGTVDVDAAAGATSLTTSDAGDFDEDGGTLAIGMVLSGGEWDYSSAQLIEYVADDETGILTLSTPLTVAAEAGDPVHLWDPLYEEAVEFQEALVVLDGDRDNPEEIVAEVAEGVDRLPEGDRGTPGESCTILRVSDDEWEVVAVGGRSARSKGPRWEQGDGRPITQAEVDAGQAVLALTHRPANEALTCVLANVPRRPTHWTIDYDAQTLTITLPTWAKADDVLWVHYAYYKGVATRVIPSPMPVGVDSASVRGTGGSGDVTLAGLAIGDVIIAACFGPGAPSVSSAAGAWNQLATATGHHDSYTPDMTVAGGLFTRVATQADVDNPTIYGETSGLVGLVAVAVRGALPLTAADASVVACELTTPTTQTIPAPAVAMAAGWRYVFAGISGGGGQTAALTPAGPLAAVTSTGAALTMSAAAAVEATDGSAPALAPAFTVSYSSLANGSDWPWVSFSVAVEGS